MRLSANPICSPVLLLLSSVVLVYGQVGYSLAQCTSLSAYTSPTCINSVNSVPLSTDGTKCIPVVESGFTVCASWLSVQSNGYTVNSLYPNSYSYSLLGCTSLTATSSPNCTYSYEGIFDTTKCISIVPTKDQSVPFGLGGTITCASLAAVQTYGYTLNTTYPGTYSSAQCTTLTATSTPTCINSVNNAATDASKCIPIVATKDQSVPLGLGGTITCASLTAVQTYVYTPVNGVGLWPSYSSAQCTSLTSPTACNNHVNNGATDSTKCIPVVTSYAPGGPITCASWTSVQVNGYVINSAIYSSSSAFQPQVQQLRYFWQWANYTYYVQSGDTYLQNLQIYQDSTQSNLAIVGYDPSSNSVVVAFRGTHNAVNVLSDLTFTTTSYPNCAGCYVYGGFWSSYGTLSSQVNSYVPTILSSHSGAKLVVVGHSLGGAQAVFSALDLKLAGYNPYLYTYGQPRVGQSTFVSWYQSQSILGNLRAVYLDDPVPDMVPTLLGYVHGSTEVQFYGPDYYLVFPTGYDTFNPPNLLAAGNHLTYNFI